MTDLPLMDEPGIQRWMQQAIDLAEQGRGAVEPNPPVGCVIVRDEKLLGQGFHRRFGGPHAEINALADCQESVAGADAIVTLEPCCHTGKTPPCTDALIRSKVRRVIIGHRDPFPKVDGGGIRRLQEAGIEVWQGPLRDTVAIQLAGFLKRVTRGQPWVIAKWAMTLDGNIATSAGNSQWISNDQSRKLVHRIRGQVDAIVVGSGTAFADNPSLTARPTGPRTPCRIVVDSNASLSVDSQLVQTAAEIPVLAVVSPKQENAERVLQLQQAGVETWSVEAGYVERIPHLLDELGQRQMTHVLVEGGGKLLSEFLAANAIDEVHVFVAPILIGAGQPPFAKTRSAAIVDQIADGVRLDPLTIESMDGDTHIRALVKRG